MNILMVDDDNAAIQHYVDALEMADGHKVTKISTFTEALAEFAKPDEPWPYQLLILDVQIRPAINGEEHITEEQSLTAGIELYRRFRQKLKQTRVIILTNNLFRVPPRIWREDPNTRAFDKALVDGIELADHLRRWTT